MMGVLLERKEGSLGERGARPKGQVWVGMDWGEAFKGRYGLGAGLMIQQVDRTGAGLSRSIGLGRV